MSGKRAKRKRRERSGKDTGVQVYDLLAAALEDENFLAEVFGVTNAGNCSERRQVLSNGSTMTITETLLWIYYCSDNGLNLDDSKCGKWMYYFKDLWFAERICIDAIEQNVVTECKHSNKDNDGVVCFYINGDDMAAHKRVIEFFLKNDLIRRTKAGKLYNISFKYDAQTRSGEYGSDYCPDIKLEKFINLETGEWIV